VALLGVLWIVIEAVEKVRPLSPWFLGLARYHS